MPRSWKYAARRKAKTCEYCGDVYQPTSSTQLWCVSCAPNRFFMVLIRKFNINHARYFEMLEEQKWRCVLCGVKFFKTHNPGGSRLLRKKPFPCVDHDYMTGQARAMLCLRCNTRLGSGDGEGEGEEAWLMRALAYVRKHRGGRSNGRASG